MIKGVVKISGTFIFTFFLAIIADQAQAEVSCLASVRRIGNASPLRKALEIGDPVAISLKTDSGTENTVVSFLGLGVWPDGTPTGAFFFNAEKMRIDFVPREKVTFKLNEGDIKLDDSQIGLITSSFNQEGGTCAAYAIFNCFHQLFLQGHIGNGLLAHHFRDEMSRQRFFTRINSKYYADGDHRGTETEVASELGFKIGELNTRGVGELQAEILKISTLRWPMLLFFDVGEQMSTTPYSIIHHGRNGETSDRRLWLPNDGRSRSNGGHQILLVRQFTDLLGREWYLMVDSNWQAPRLWSADEAIKLRSGRIGGWALWQEGSNPSTLPPSPRTPFLVEPEIVPINPPPKF